MECLEAAWLQALQKDRRLSGETGVSGEDLKRFEVLLFPSLSRLLNGSFDLRFDMVGTNKLPPQLMGSKRAKTVAMENNTLIQTYLRRNLLNRLWKNPSIVFG